MNRNRENFTFKMIKLVLWHTQENKKKISIDAIRNRNEI